jgi:hypothetical protein
LYLVALVFQPLIAVGIYLIKVLVVMTHVLLTVAVTASVHRLPETWYHFCYERCHTVGGSHCYLLNATSQNWTATIPLSALPGARQAKLQRMILVGMGATEMFLVACRALAKEVVSLMFRHPLLSLNLSHAFLVV